MVSTRNQDARARGRTKTHVLLSFWDLAAGAVSFQDEAYQVLGQTCMHCMFNIIGVPVHRTFCTFAKWGAAFLAPKLGTNTLKSHGSHKGPKVHLSPAPQGLVHAHQS